MSKLKPVFTFLEAELCSFTTILYSVPHGSIDLICGGIAHRFPHGPDWCIFPNYNGASGLLG
ncbi:hypothetical protein SETIT_7G085200v2 [Setaria italica]|uniref:Uncharacterized protein n=1 Tax=Setaria italica TaxID=4555 RepID=A0A368RT86_SETIT|nr:hypothetical protein SETIT_7G085200v2 [Setaria italica]